MQYPTEYVHKIKFATEEYVTICYISCGTRHAYFMEQCPCAHNLKHSSYQEYNLLKKLMFQKHTPVLPVEDTTV